MFSSQWKKQSYLKKKITLIVRMRRQGSDSYMQKLLGLSRVFLVFFLEGSDFEKIQREESLDIPPMPPQGRNWKGSIVAPFAGSNMLALYQCPGKTDVTKISQDHKGSYFVQVLHNEAPVSMLEKIVEPYLKYDLDALCKIRPVVREEPASFSSKMLSFFLGLLSQKGYRC